MNQVVTGVRAYQKVGLESKVAAASPQKLIELLFDGANTAIGKAIIALRDGDMVSMGQSIGKANAIVVDGLQGCLKVDPKNEVSVNLSNLYTYVSTTLLKANLHRDEGLLVEARDLLASIGGAWKEGTKSA